jgi:hypothetical protein
LEAFAYDEPAVLVKTLGLPASAYHRHREKRYVADLSSNLARVFGCVADSV